MKAARKAESCNWVIDFESHLQNEVDFVALLILWNYFSGESSVRNQFPVPLQSLYQTKPVITISTWAVGGGKHLFCVNEKEFWKYI
jgi:hypothetical protein